MAGKKLLVLAVIVVIILSSGLYFGKPALSLQQNTETTFGGTIIDPTLLSPTEPVGGQTTTEMTVSPSEALDEIKLHEVFQELLSVGFETRDYWYNRAMLCQFSRACDLQVEYIFYNGFYDVGEWDSFTDDEYDYLIQQGFERNFSVQKLPADLVDDILNEYFDVGIEEVVIPENWVYYGKTNSYYTNHNGGKAVPFFNVTDVQYGANGEVCVSYTIEGLYKLHDSDVYIENQAMVMVLKEKKDGSYSVLSNLPVEY